jgi:methylase of polypeptide subunit release factors
VPRDPVIEAGAVEADSCLLGLLGQLSRGGYRFVTPTPATHLCYLARERARPARDLRDVFGWNLAFAADLLPAPLFGLLRDGGLLDEQDGLWRSRVRVASIGDRLFLHSAFPTESRDSIFLGPDSYRFVRFIRAELERIPPVRHLVDIGAGAGVGAIMAHAQHPGAMLTLVDANPAALRFARLNARHAGIAVKTIEGDGLDPVAAPFDVAIANPPFMADPANRAYRDGGGMHGAALSICWARAAASRLAPGGRMLLYSASAIVAGRDRLEQALREMLPPLGCSLRYEEIDPDIFGDQLREPGYDDVERIAAIGAVIEKQEAH